jgi:hypothetical protein
MPKIKLTKKCRDLCVKIGERKGRAAEAQIVTQWMPDVKHQKVDVTLYETIVSFFPLPSQLQHILWPHPCSESAARLPNETRALLMLAS